MPDNPWDNLAARRVCRRPTSWARVPNCRAGFPAELSDTTWFTDRGLDYLRGKRRHKPWFLHLGYYRPASAVCRAGAVP